MSNSLFVPRQVEDAKYFTGITDLLFQLFEGGLVSHLDLLRGVYYFHYVNVICVFHF